MKRKTKISIPKSCQENWLELNTDEKRIFCNLCQKNIFEDSFSNTEEVFCLSYNSLLNEIESTKKQSIFRKLTKFILKSFKH